MEEIFHTCKATGQTFTWKEWVEYIRNGGSYDDVVYSFNGYNFNINSVCINPTPVVTEKIDLCYNFSVRIAQYEENKYLYGIRVMFATSSMSDPCLIGDEVFETKKEAITSALNEIEKYIKKCFENYYNHKGEDSKDSADLKAKQMFKRLRALKEFYNPRQLELFA